MDNANISMAAVSLSWMVFVFLLYLLLNWIAKSIDRRSVVKLSDQEVAKSWISQIYACKTIDALKSSFEEFKNSGKKHLDFLQLVYNERHQELTQHSPKSKNSLIRRIWFIGFCLFAGIPWVSAILTLVVVIFAFGVENFGAPSLMLAGVFSGTLFLGAVFWSGYVRKKVGWLTLYLLLNSLMLSFFVYVGFTSEDGINLLGLLVVILIYSGYCVLTFKLIQQNQKMKSVAFLKALLEPTA